MQLDELESGEWCEGGRRKNVKKKSPIRTADTYRKMNPFRQRLSLLWRSWVIRILGPGFRKALTFRPAGYPPY